MNLFSNIISNYNYLKHDFTGIVFSYSTLFNLLINVLFSLIIIIIFYLLGEKIKSFFLKNNNSVIDFFIRIALGYIFTASIILVLGMFQILYFNVLYIYYVFLLVIAVYPLSTLKNRLRILLDVYKE